ncbi:hypothetical protein Psed_6844 (plasmid) [Pseudonocardia dioxanivorans CB1190]|uniref:Uncharacterized protein n=1 Tax=Pseudonocardia dioxanivorans (strain ATCC 55486 / DSM 44775 / JCM 13855 / CB1190) TaxID=675635 RepID=F2L6M1_PSEUX|nr:hypothetical protein [Pseudonocardia dioxanivorans]AEA28915.1 hypothetical protein Psed_6844 [Pseudonocardia dioxanivorans CB1190]
MPTATLEIADGYTERDAQIVVDLDEDAFWHRGGPYPAPESADDLDEEPPF